MRPGLGTILRLVGPLLQVLCVFGVLRVRGRGLSALGYPAEYPFYAGFAAGFVLVGIGLVLSRRPPRPRDRWDVPRDRP